MTSRAVGGELRWRLRAFTKLLGMADGVAAVRSQPRHCSSSGSSFVWQSVSHAAAMARASETT